MTTKTVITGAAGFLGSHLVNDLLSKGHFVIGIDNLSSGKKKNLTSLLQNKNFVFIQTDVCSSQIIKEKELKGIDEIYHLASPASPVFYQKSPFATIDINTTGTKNMLELARQTGAKLVFTSTSEVYGDPEVHPQHEKYRGSVNTWGPRACYDESKRLGEVYCYLYHKLYGVKVKVARIFNTYSAGLRNDDGRVISNFVSQALKGDDITVYGTGEQTRSFCYVTDTVRGLQLMMEREEANGEVINIGNPHEYSILDVARMVKRISGTASKITFHPLPEDDPKQRRPIIDKAKRLLNWEPKVSLEEGLSMTLEAYKHKMDYL